VTNLAEAGDFTPIGGEYDDDVIERALSWASSAIVSYCGRTFDLVTDDIELSDPYFGSGLLGHIPVVEISLVEAYLPSGNGMAWTTLTNYGFNAKTGLIYDTTGLPGTTFSTGAFTWPWLPQSLRVTYTHGFAAVPQEIVDACCRLAQQYLENPALVMQRRVGDIDQRFSGSRGVDMSNLDRSILDRYVIVSIA
jgi:hypothetical protein